MIRDILKNYKVLLGSNSPRRRELLTMMDIPFEVVKFDVDESYPANLPATEVPLYLSKLKSEAYRPKLKDGQLLITADTVVICDGKILGKPSDERQAVEMLKTLSGRHHKVVTGVTIATPSSTESFSETTEVEFDNIADDDIKYYVSKYHPLDKAGAYGIQEWIGTVGIKGINGCYYNVMGLPTTLLHRRLPRFLQ